METNNKIHCWFLPLYQPQSYWWACKKWCNPAPADGSAPNLVIEGKDKQGKPCFRRAFNTQARFIFCLILAPDWLSIHRLVNNWMHGLEDMNQFWKKWLQETLTGSCIVCYFTIQNMWLQSNSRRQVVYTIVVVMTVIVMTYSVFLIYCLGLLFGSLQN